MLNLTQNHSKVEIVDQNGQSVDVFHGIYPCIDTVRIHFVNFSLGEIFKAFQLTDYVDDSLVDFLKSRHNSTDHSVRVVVFSVLGIRIAIPTYCLGEYFSHYMFPYATLDSYQTEYAEVTASREFMNKSIDKIEIYMGGSCLRNLRRKGIPIDDLFFNGITCDLTKCQTVHFSRCDFAYDLINVFPDFLPKFYDLCDKCGDKENGFLSVYRPNKSTQMKYMLYNIGGFGLTLGKHNGNKHFLRVYDKLREIAIKDNYEDYDYFGEGKSTIYSWTRLEFQAGRDVADQLFLQNAGLTLHQRYCNVFKYIKDTFTVNNGHLHNNKDKGHDIFDNLIDWSQCNGLTKIVYFVQSVDYETLLQQKVVSNLSTCLAYVLCYGKEAFDRLFAEFAAAVYDGDKLDPYFKRIRSKVNQMARSICGDGHPPYLTREYDHFVVNGMYVQKNTDFVDMIAENAEILNKTFYARTPYQLPTGALVNILRSNGFDDDEIMKAANKLGATPLDMEVS